MKIPKVLYFLILAIILVAAFAGGRASNELGTTTTHTYYSTSYVVAHVNSTFYDHETSTIYTNSTTVTRTMNTTLANTTITVTVTRSTGS